MKPPPSILLALSFAASTGCSSWPGLADPTITLAPEYVLFRTTGTTSLQSSPPLQDNQPSSLAQLGTGKRDSDLAVRASYGDGFSGFDFEYLYLDQQSTGTGFTQDDWGSIPGGVEVNSNLRLDEFRLRYIARVFEWLDEDEVTWVKAGLGLQLGHKDMKLRVWEIAVPNAQEIQIKDDVSPYVAARLAAGRGPFSVLADFAYNGDWEFGTGDLQSEMYDFQVRVSYFLEAQDLTLFGGYRRFDVPAVDNVGPLEYVADFTLDGYVFGVEFVF